MPSLVEPVTAPIQGPGPLLSCYIWGFWEIGADSVPGGQFSLTSCCVLLQLVPNTLMSLCEHET